MLLASMAFDDAERATFRSRADSLDWERNRALAERAKEFRVVVSLFDRQSQLESPNSWRI